MHYQTDIIKFTEIMYGLADNFGSELSKPGLKMRFDALSSFTIEQINKAAMAILATRKFKSMPTVADFLEHLQPQLQITPENKAQIEADKIISHLKFHGATRFPQISDPITKHLMTKRWPYQNWAREVLESELKWWVKEFIGAYQAYTESGGCLMIEAPTQVLELTGGIGNFGK